MTTGHLATTGLVLGKVLQIVADRLPAPIPIFDLWPFAAAGVGTGVWMGSLCYEGIAALLSCLFRPAEIAGNAPVGVDIDFLLVATCDGYDALVQTLVQSRETFAMVQVPVVLLGHIERTVSQQGACGHICMFLLQFFSFQIQVEVLIWKYHGKPRFFVRCQHFCSMPFWCVSVAAALVVLFQLAGAPLEDAQVRAILKMGNETFQAAVIERKKGLGLICACGIRRSACPKSECGGGGGLCACGIRRTYCTKPECGGGGHMCSHGVRRTYCRRLECGGGGSNCKCGIRRTYCDKQACGGGGGLCACGVRRNLCRRKVDGFACGNWTDQWVR